MPRVRRIHSTVMIIGVTMSVITFFVSVPESHAENNSTQNNIGTQNIADNTGKNARDKSGVTLTPMDQSNDKRDLDMTQKIRKALVDDDSLSNNAKNIKVITVNGIVTLRGPVESAEERKKIVAKAKSIADGKLKNELEINSSK